MRKLILLLLLLPFLSSAQKTYVPDDNFEQLLINLGYDNILDDSVLTQSIDTITFIVLDNLNISDLIGIEDFTSLETLLCSGNNLVTLDVSNNLNLIEFDCSDNNLITLDVSANSALRELFCSENPLTNLILNDTSLFRIYCSHTSLNTINLSNNSNLEVAVLGNCNLSSINLNGAVKLNFLYIENNNLNLLDITTNINLEILYAVNNNLSSLDLRNGNNINLFLNAKQNPNLTCISVDDTVWANTNWTAGNNIDSQHYFSEDCNSTNIKEVKESKQILRIVDVLGKEIPYKKNTPLFYLYNDGTVEKKIIID